MPEDGKKQSRHGLGVLKVAIKVRGLSAIDGRTAAAQALFAWRKDLVRDLGGETQLSAQRLALVDLAVRTRLYIDHVDAFLMGQASLVNRKKKAILPILSQRTQLVDSLQRTLTALGLDRVERRVPSLEEYFSSKTAEAAEDEQAEAPESPEVGP